MYRSPLNGHDCYKPVLFDFNLVCGKELSNTLSGHESKVTA